MVNLNTKRITDVIARMFVRELGYGVLREFKLRVRRRVDLIVLGENNQICIVEIKSSPQDFLKDKKWNEYVEWADKYYFGVGADFPKEILPSQDCCGIIITDGFDCHEAQPAPLKKLNSMRRNALVREIAKVSMRRAEHACNSLLKMP